MMKSTAYLGLLFVSFGCASHLAMKDICRDKVSSKVLAFVESASSEEALDVTVVVTDSTGLSAEFHELTFPFQSLGLGKCSQATILKLCKHEAIRYIDVPKTRFPSSNKTSETR